MRQHTHDSCTMTGVHKQRTTLYTNSARRDTQAQTQTQSPHSRRVYSKKNLELLRFQRDRVLPFHLYNVVLD